MREDNTDLFCKGLDRLLLYLYNANLMGKLTSTPNKERERERVLTMLKNKYGEGQEEEGEGEGVMYDKLTLVVENTLWLSMPPSWYCLIL